MEYNNLGLSGLVVSQLSYGAWHSIGDNLGVNEVKSILQCCRDHGVNFFDNSEACGRTEEVMGQAIKELGWNRSQVVISTKISFGGFGHNEYGLSRKHIIEGTKASLRRLQMDYVDLIYCHVDDPYAPIEETVRAMNYVIDKGWAFYWGICEWSSKRIAEAWSIAQRLDLLGPIVIQPRYNLLTRHKVETEYRPLYKNYDMTLTTSCPLASGVLTGKYINEIPPELHYAMEDFEFQSAGTLSDNNLQRKLKTLKVIAHELNMSMAQLAIAWCAANPNVSSVIIGATTESQIKENMKTIDLIPSLTADVMQWIEDELQSKEKLD